MLKNRVPGCSSDPCTMSQAAPPIPAQCHPNRTFFCAEADWASPVVYFVARVSAESFNVWVADYLVIITSLVGTSTSSTSEARGLEIILSF